MTYVEESESKGCIEKMLREVHRILQPGGKAVFTTKQHLEVLATEVRKKRCAQGGGQGALGIYRHPDDNTPQHYRRYRRRCACDQVGGIDNAEKHWCGLDWTVSAEMVFLKTDENGSAEQDAVAVGTREELPPDTRYVGAECWVPVLL